MPLSPDQEQKFALRFLEDVFPEAVAIAPHTLEDDATNRLRAAGLGVAQILFKDTSTVVATYIFEDTSYVKALSLIHDQEAQGVLPVDSHRDAIDAIADGSFNTKWLEFLKE